VTYVPCSENLLRRVEALWKVGPGLPDLLQADHIP